MPQNLKLLVGSALCDLKTPSPSDIPAANSSEVHVLKLDSGLAKYTSEYLEHWGGVNVKLIASSKEALTLATGLRPASVVRYPRPRENTAMEKKLLENLAYASFLEKCEGEATMLGAPLGLTGVGLPWIYAVAPLKCADSLSQVPLQCVPQILQVCEGGLLLVHASIDTTRCLDMTRFVESTGGRRVHTLIKEKKLQATYLETGSLLYVPSSQCVAFFNPSEDTTCVVTVLPYLSKNLTSSAVFKTAVTAHKAGIEQFVHTNPNYSFLPTVGAVLGM